jgi:hypothetical protein
MHMKTQDLTMGQLRYGADHLCTTTYVQLPNQQLDQMEFQKISKK